MGIRQIRPPDRQTLLDFAGDTIDAVLAQVDEYPFDGHAWERQTRMNGRVVTVTVAIGEP